MLSTSTSNLTQAVSIKRNRISIPAMLFRTLQVFDYIQSFRKENLLLLHQFISSLHFNNSK